MRKGFTIFELAILVFIVAVVAIIAIPRLMRTNPESERYVLLTALAGGCEDVVLYDSVLDQAWLLSIWPDAALAHPLFKKRAELFDQMVDVPHVLARETRFMDGRATYTYASYAIEWKNGEYVLRQEERTDPNLDTEPFRTTSYRLDPFLETHNGMALWPIRKE